MKDYYSDSNTPKYPNTKNRQTHKNITKIINATKIKIS